MLNFSAIKKSAAQAKALFFDIFYPRRCLGCGRFDVWLCEGCARALPRPRVETQFFDFSQETDERVIYLDGLFSLSRYTNSLTLSLIKTFKYQFVSEIGFDLGLLLAWRFARAIETEKFFSHLTSLRRFASQASLAWPGALDFYFSLTPEKRYQQPIKPFAKLKPPANILIIPVPLHKRRQRWRGFNQAEIIARQLSACFCLDLTLNQLVRQRYTKPQAKLNTLRRWQSIKGSFSWQGASLNNQTVFLIDDVATTGATLNECARILKQAGADKVWGLVIARG